MLAGIPVKALVEKVIRVKNSYQVNLLILVLVGALEELVAGDLVVSVIGLLLDLVDIIISDSPVPELLLQISLVFERTALVLTFDRQRLYLCRASICT
jgi:hypothetical protein